MQMVRRFSIRILLCLCFVSAAVAQDTAINHRTALTVTAFASSDRVRFAATTSVVQIRLEVYDSTGKKLFDNEVRGGNVLDWHLQNGQAEQIPDDTYLCVVTVKSLSGRITQRVGSVALEKNIARVQTADTLQMTAQQIAAIGPVEENSSFSVLGEDGSQTTTVIAHNGDEGLITRGRGALTFRIGDFFRSKDIEQMRLTPEGNLGIGLTNPQAKLDVDGMIRTNQGIVFPDGSIQFSAARKTFGDASIKPGQPQHTQGVDAAALAPDTSGTGTTGKLPKWQDGPNGVLTDSNITEFGSSIGINGMPDTRFKLDVNGSTRLRGSNPGFNLEGLRAAGNTWLFQTVDDDGRFRLFGQDNSNPGVERFTIKLDTGNIGISAPNPQRTLQIGSSPDALFTFSPTDGSPNAGYIRFGDKTGWKLHIGRNRESSGGPLNTGTTGALMTIQDNGTVGIGTVDTSSAKLTVVAGNSTGVLGTSVDGIGVHGVSRSSSGYAVYGENTGTGTGVFGQSNDANSYGVRGQSSNGIGVQGFSSSGIGVEGFSFNLAGIFGGDVEITGNLTKGGGSFKIDHPLDPENKYLYHSFVESPDMLNIYSGIVILNEQGEAVVLLPQWFGALNRDFRYQLTCIGDFAPIYVAEEIKDNRFKIAGGRPEMKISWLVTGVRQDAYANAHRIQVEEKKSEKDRGRYLHPEVFNQPSERRIGWERYERILQQIEQRRTQEMHQQPTQVHHPL